MLLCCIMQVYGDLREIALRLQGPDVYWDNSCIIGEKSDAKYTKSNQSSMTTIEETENKSFTKFGELSIVPFPLCIKITFEDTNVSKTTYNSKQDAILSFSPFIANRKNQTHNKIQSILTKLDHLVQKNYKPEIMRRKNMRLRFRALENCLINWPIQRTHKKRVSKKVTVTKTRTNNTTGEQETYQDTETIYETVDVLFSFTNATFVIQKGFWIELHYKDGIGINPIAGDGWQPASWSNEIEEEKGDIIGINPPEYQMNATLKEFFGNKQNWNNTHERKMDMILDEWRKNREDKCKAMVEKEKVLSYAFWYYVYNNDRLSKEKCIKALDIESNQLMKRLCTDREYKQCIDLLFDKYISFYNGSKRNALWFLFWNDVWKYNSDNVKLIKKNGNIFNPNVYFQATRNRSRYNGDKDKEKEKEKEIMFDECLAFNYQSKDNLINILDSLGLHETNILIRKGWFNDGIIDSLYELMDDIENENKNKNTHKQDRKNKNEADTKLLITVSSPIKHKIKMVKPKNGKGKFSDDNKNDYDEKEKLEQFGKKYKNAATLIRTIFNVDKQINLRSRDSVANVHRKR